MSSDASGDSTRASSKKRASQNRKRKKLAVEGFLREELEMMIENIQRAIEIVQNYDVSNEEAFSAMLRLCVRSTQIGQVDAAASLQITTGTMSRWMAGETIPPVYSRVGVVEQLKKFLHQQLDLVRHIELDEVPPVVGGSKVIEEFGRDVEKVSKRPPPLQPDSDPRKPAGKRKRMAK